MNRESKDRRYWLEQMLKITGPVLEALSLEKLKEQMPVEAQDGHREERKNYTYLEAFGRSLAGMAPWLEGEKMNPTEESLRRKYALLARASIDAATNPRSKDHMNFNDGQQPLVDAAFLAHAILRAPGELVEPLDESVKRNLIECLKKTRTIRPFANNWLLFSAMIETALYVLEGQWDAMRVDYALKQHMQWYVGDGTFGDGYEYHCDYYNSYVIQPMLVDILRTVGHVHQDWQEIAEKMDPISRRHAVVLERMIAPDGTYPPIGRSLVYRFASFQHLAQSALQQNLPESLHPVQVRCGLTAVIRKVMESPDMFDHKGWLQVGLYGHQPALGEEYVSTGSLYLCSTVFLPLGLDTDAVFWSDEERPWTSKRIWEGQNVHFDKALRHMMRDSIPGS